MIRRSMKTMLCLAGMTATRTAPARGDEGVICRLWREQRGAVIVEFAILAPVLLLILVGIMIFGLALNQYATLWNAVGASAVQFAFSGNSSPATLAWNVLAGAAPTFTTGVSCSSGLCLTLYVNGTACATNVDSATAAASADSACYGDLQPGGIPAQVVATYPCTLQVLQYNFYPNCQLTAQVTELVP
jgi:Flp pilus assembly protein TadG